MDQVVNVHQHYEGFVHLYSDGHSSGSEACGVMSAIGFREKRCHKGVWYMADACIRKLCQ